MVHNDLLHGCSGNAGSHCLGVRRWNPSSEEAIQNNGQQADAGFFFGQSTHSGDGCRDLDAPF